MPIKVNPDLIDEIKAYGAFDISACFNCGNCTAVCPLSETESSFPRKLIRSVQIGDKSQILDGPEPWLCYACGECGETCPREAQPQQFMAAIRQYAIASAEPSGLAGIMYRSLGVLLAVTMLMGLVLGAFLLGRPQSGELPHLKAWLFGTVPYETIHNMGIVVFILATLVILYGLLATGKNLFQGVSKPSFKALFNAVKWTVGEIATMRRHREELDGPASQAPYLLRASIAHKGIMFGFIALLAATALDFLFITLLPLGLVTFWPARFIGIVGGILLMYGVSVAMYRRLTKAEKNVESSTPADWWVLIFLFVLGITGFWLLGVVTVRHASAFNDFILLLHAAMAMELVLLITFTKMAHVLYRPLALLAYRLRTQPK